MPGGQRDMSRRVDSRLKIALPILTMGLIVAVASDLPAHAPSTRPSIPLNREAGVFVGIPRTLVLDVNTGTILSTQPKGR